MNKRKPYINFGQYKGASVESIAENDPDYLQYLLNQEWFQEEKWMHLYQIVEEELEKVSLLDPIVLEP